MSETIEIEVCDIHKDIHEQLSASVDGYDEKLRDEVENTIHEIYQHTERAQE